MADANARSLRVREAGGIVIGAGSGRKVVDGGEGGLDCDGKVGPLVMITGDDFDGERAPATGKANEISAQFRKQNSRENIARKKDQEGKVETHLFAAVRPGIYWPAATTHLFSGASATSVSHTAGRASHQRLGSGDAVLVYMAEKSMLGA